MLQEGPVLKIKLILCLKKIPLQPLPVHGIVFPKKQVLLVQKTIFAEYFQDAGNHTIEVQVILTFQSVDFRKF